MTVLVGIVCNDGLVIASDSQESTDYMKRLDVRKVYDSSDGGDLDVDDVCLIAAGAGTTVYISRFIEELNKRIYTPDFVWPRDVADAGEDAMNTLYRRYGDDLKMGVILGVWCANSPKGDERQSPFGLYTVHTPGVAAKVTDYAAMGSGEPFASYLLHRLHYQDQPTMNLSVSAAINEAIYVVEETKKVQLHCGGATQLAYIENGKLRRKSAEEIYRLAGGIGIVDEKIKESQRNTLTKAGPLTV